MRNYILSLFVFAGVYCVAQTPGFSYQIKLQGIDDRAEAKPLIDNMRLLFKAYTAFSDSLQAFDFNSETDVTSADFSNWATANSFTVLSFLKQNCVCIKDDDE